jgi:hypothetical protein
MLFKKKKGVLQELYKMAAQSDPSKMQLTELKVHVIFRVLHSHRQKSCKKEGEIRYTYVSTTSSKLLKLSGQSFG